MVMISEMVNYYRLQGKRLDQVLDELSKIYGYHADIQYSIFFKGQRGQETMKEIMAHLHESPLTEIAGKKVITVEDYLYLSRISGDQEEFIENLPSTDAVKYYLEDGTSIAIRPSGTEPKCKFYYGAVSKISKQEAIDEIKRVHQSVLDTLKIEQ